jgi:uncharacterized membrane protein (UPF0127 family)
VIQLRRPRRPSRAPLAVMVLLTALASPCCKTVTAPAAALGPAAVIKNQQGKEWTVALELARTPEEQHQGLMWRFSLAPDHGMLFIYSTAAPRTFWMRNTRIPLDMIFIGSDQRIAGIVANAEPYTDTSRSVPAPSQWVLEVAGGECAKHGVQAGDPVYFFNLGDK